MLDTPVATLSVLVSYDPARPAVRLSGELDMSTADSLVDLMRTSFPRPPDRLSLDLGGTSAGGAPVTFVDVVGMHALVRVAVLLHHRGCALELSGLTPLQRRLLGCLGPGAMLPLQPRRDAGAATARGSTSHGDGVAT